MDEELKCDFYFGDKVNTPIKVMDVESLNGYKATVRNKTLFNTGWIWQFNVWKLVFKPYKYYIITGDPYVITNYIIAIVALFLNKKVYVWSHGMKGGENKKRRALEKFFYRLCFKVLLYGEYSKQIMLNEGFKEDKLICIYNSLDYSQQLKIRNGLKASNIYSDYFKNDHPVLIYIGRIQKSKKLDYLINSLQRLKQEGIACNIVIIGKDVENVGLEALVNEHKLEDQVWLYGPCYKEEEIASLIYNADLCVSPGPVGLTALHAMTYGTPVISNDNLAKQMPEFEVITKKQTGDFYIENDIEDLTLKIKEWINLSIEKRSSIRKNAYKIIDTKYNPLYQIKVLKELTK